MGKQKHMELLQAVNTAVFHRNQPDNDRILGILSVYTEYGQTVSSCIDVERDTALVTYLYSRYQRKEAVMYVFLWEAAFSPGTSSQI